MPQPWPICGPRPEAWSRSCSSPSSGKAGQLGGSGKDGPTDGIQKAFRPVHQHDALAKGLRFFLQKVIRKSALVGKAEAKKIAKACDEAEMALNEAMEENG